MFEISGRGICYTTAVYVGFSLPSAGWTVPKQCYWIEIIIG
jgi:hypothetical protein